MITDRNLKSCNSQLISLLEEPSPACWRPDNAATRIIQPTWSARAIGRTSASLWTISFLVSPSRKSTRSPRMTTRYTPMWCSSSFSAWRLVHWRCSVGEWAPVDQGGASVEGTISSSFKMKMQYQLGNESRHGSSVRRR